MADCKYCGDKAGFLRRRHKECESVHAAGWREMVSLAAAAAAAPDFSEAALQVSLAAIARRSWVEQDGINAAVAEGWREAVGSSLADGILTQDEEARLHEFRDRLALGADGASGKPRRSWTGPPATALCSTPGWPPWR